MSRVVARAVQAIVLAVFAAALAVASLVQNAEEKPATETRAGQAAHVAWTPDLAARWPGCIDQAGYQGPQHFVPATVLVQDYWRSDGAVRPMPLDRALAHNQTESTRDDVWLVASCRGDIR